ncbi:2'-5' RNA ligase family protein [Streptomyces rhizosphaerihabitans]|uniref:2'-5' RNA ligase family protein n=1 Tax=Streptomyces rhizosphaerihabitans TaxID=1266770 RepID=UPI0021C1D4FF|nr:2'-5' RNA ligase family protein [Streptomyces rhizosphaerihabitans]MCT9008999.1 2'-5' RNA ligase family protein [Streptomyces rhizosphaerihabitans]
MAGDDSSESQAGQSGLVVRVPELEPVVRAWRERLDPSAVAGVPAHVTVLFPFLDETRIDSGTLAAIDGVIGCHQPFEARFEHFGRFPGTLYLAPEPDASFRRLTEAIVQRWPETPPYGGQFDDIVPHLTIAQAQDDAVLDVAEADLHGRLPVIARVSSVDLFVHDGSQWQQRASFALR